MQWLRRNIMLIGGLGLAVGLAGCSDSTNPGSAELSTAEVADFADAGIDEAEAGAEALTVEGTVNPAGATLSVGGISTNLSAPPGDGCATVSSSVDTDGDGTPDAATFTYALPACHITGFRGGTLDLTGSITVTDPTPSAADLNRSVTLSDFTFNFTSADATRSFVAVRNGTRQASGNASGITLNNNVTVERTATGHPTVTAVHTLQFMFTPAAGSTITPGQQLPDGEITSTGSVTLSRGDASRVFTVSTPVPLTYDASCAGPRRARISAGEVRWTLPSGAYIRTVWTSCGVRPERTFVPAA